MKASEFRIGNICIEKYTGELLRVISVNDNEQITFSGHFTNKWQAEPIALTKEWLLRFGFFDNSYANFFIDINAEYASLCISFKDYACAQIREDVTIDDHDINLPCRYVHQLQNLYFALTGQELTLKP